VLPLETLGGQLSNIRGITTRSQSGGVSDGTWREVNTVRIVDTVLPGIRVALRVRLLPRQEHRQDARRDPHADGDRAGELSPTGIIDSYSDVSVAAEESDPTVCRDSFRFTVRTGSTSLSSAPTSRSER
jgi:hypothetical protein